MTELQPLAPESNQGSPSTIPNAPQDHTSTGPSPSVPVPAPTPASPALVPPQPQQSQQQELDQAELARARVLNEKALKDSREGVWFLKVINFNGQRKKIVTQNYNGPCSFIAICNILILRGDIEILPPERTSVSYEFLAQLVGEYLLRASPDVDVSAALTMMPLTQKGMDLNPLFTSSTAFRPHGDNGALKLFEQANIPLVHGWLADPHSPEYPSLARIGDYDAAVNLIVEADILAKGQLVLDENAPGPSGSSSSADAGSSSSGAGPGPSSSHAYGYSTHVHVSDGWSAEEKRKVEDALAAQRFLDSTSSQLTYHGLFTLASSIEPGSLVALFRNSHLSVLYRRPIPPSSSPPIASSSSTPIPSSTPSLPNPSSSAPNLKTEADPSLYSLVTDHIFHNEPSVVWERLEDVDGSSSTFVDSDFRRSAPVGGDFAGASRQVLALSRAAAGLEDDDAKGELYAEVDPADQELARFLQAEEDARAQAAYARRQAQHQQQQHPQSQQTSSSRWLPQSRQQQQQFDPRDPRYAAYMEQQEYIRQQQMQYGPGGHQGQGLGQGQEGGSSEKKPFHKLKRKTSCLIM